MITFILYVLLAYVLARFLMLVCSVERTYNRCMEEFKQYQELTYNYSYEQLRELRIAMHVVLRLSRHRRAKLQKKVDKQGSDVAFYQQKIEVENQRISTIKEALVVITQELKRRDFFRKHRN